MTESDPHSDLVLELAEEFLARYRRGERPPLKEYVDRHPALAAEIREVFPAMALMERVAIADSSLAGAPTNPGRPPAPPPAPVPDPLPQFADFRLIREVGRGGMGVVYEAEQLSLGRHVALKVLPPHARDAGLRGRFEREAKAAARLHHTNIVPVFGVGEQAGQPYYVMQFIQGLGLDAILRELKRLPGPAGTPAPRPPLPPGDVSAVTVAHSLITGVFAKVDAADDTSVTVPGPSSGPIDELSGPTLSSTSAVLLGRGRPGVAVRFTYWQSVAQVGAQVADALEYAHKHGVLHRDIKPSNLLLDLQGTAWVTDFGLAKADDQENLTNTGDVLGTVRYMAPERFDGMSLPASDVYSLGLTLYELLAFRPAFEERDRSRLVRQVTTTDPPRLDRLNPAVPRDLVTVIHKAIEADPARRYATAGELAADLRRFLDDQPVQARRVSGVERLARWARRNKGVAAALGVIALLLGATALVSTLGVVLLTAANERERRANEVAQAARRTAEEKEDETRAERDVARHRLYLANMNLAQREWEAGNVAHVRKLLGDWVPQHPGDRDLRGWEWHYQDRICRGELRTYRGHDGPITAAAVSPDGALLASAGDDGTVRLWDASTGRIRCVLRGHRSAARAVAFSPDGTRLVSGGLDGTIRGWTLEGDQVFLLQHRGSVACLAYSTDGTRLVSAGGDGALTVWNLARAQPALTIDCRQGDVNGVAFNPDGTRLATTGDDGTLRMWDARSGEPLRSITIHRGENRCVAFSRDGARLAVAGQHGSVRVWPASGEGEPLLIQTPSSWVYGLAFHPAAAQLATGGDDGIIRLWDLTDGKERRRYQGHTDWVRSVAFSSDGTRLVTAGVDGTVRVWDALSDREPVRLVGPAGTVFSLGFSPDGRRLLSSWDDDRVRIWDPHAGPHPVQELNHGGKAEWAAFAPDGARVASGGRDRVIRIWDTATGHQIHALSGHRGEVNGLAFHPDGNLLASVGDEGDVFLWDALRGDRVRQFTGHDGEVRRAVFHPDGRRLMTAGMDGTVRVWEVATGAELLTLRGHQRGVMDVAVDRDGTRLASAGEDGIVRLWDATTGRELDVLQGHRGSVRAVVFNPDGSRLASGGLDGTVRVWDTGSGDEVRVLRVHTNWVRAVAFSPGGEWLASCSSDGTIRLLDARPWTPAIQVAEEARGLVAGLFATPLSAAEVLDRVRQHRGLSPEVRRFALELAGRGGPDLPPVPLPPTE